MTSLSQNSLVDCRGGCGTQVDKGKFGELCRECWYKEKNKKLQTPAVNRVQDPNRWHRGQTMCIYCHEQTRTIRAMKLHYHMTDHLYLYDALTPEQKEQWIKDREKAIELDPYEGDEKRAWF